MTKLRLIQLPSNPRRLSIEKSENGGEWEQVMLTYMDPYLQRPLKTTYPDPDPLIVQGAKILTSNLRGFDSWEQLRDFFASIPDAEAYAQAQGHNLADLLTQ
jgi:hypothetical protein